MRKVLLDGQPVELTSFASEKILVDTNLLVFAHHEGSEYHRQAALLMLACLQGSLRACVSSQNLLEFFSVMTSSNKVRPMPDRNSVSRICSDLLSSRNLGKIYPGETAVVETIETTKERELHGPRIFDCFLAITARQNRVDRIWTDNISDLRIFENFVAVENPLVMNWELGNHGF